MHELEHGVNLTVYWVFEHDRGQQVGQALTLTHIHGGLHVQLIEPYDSIMHQFYEGLNLPHQSLQKLLVLLMFELSFLRILRSVVERYQLLD